MLKYDLCIEPSGLRLFCFQNQDSIRTLHILTHFVEHFTFSMKTMLPSNPSSLLTNPGTRFPRDSRPTLFFPSLVLRLSQNPDSHVLSLGERQTNTGAPPDRMLGEGRPGSDPGNDPLSLQAPRYSKHGHTGKHTIVNTSNFAFVW